MVRRLPLLLALVALLAAAALPAQAQAPAPGCQGVQVTDDAGDAGGPFGIPGAATDNLDVLAGWFTTVGTKTQAHLQVANMSKELPDGADEVSMGLYWPRNENEDSFVSLTIDEAGGLTYQFGYVDNVASNVFFDGTTKGSIVEGDKGVITIDVPSSIAKAGAKIEAPFARTTLNVQFILFDSDETEAGKTYTVQPCDGATPPPGSGTQGPPPGSGTGENNTSTTQQTQLFVDTKSAKRKKALAIKLRSTGGQVENVTGTLKKGRKTVGKGKLGAVNGTATMKVKLKKKPKKGTYTFTVAGTDQQNRNVTAKRKLKIK